MTDWVNCPICDEPDMRCEPCDGGKLIHCVNLSCASNGGAKPTCAHEWVPIYDHCRCTRCSAVRTDSGWGIASRMTFKSLAEAKFYQGTGRYPE